MKRPASLAVILAVVAVLTVPTAMAGTLVTVRDEFRSIAYDGNDGTTNWVAPWDEFEWNDGEATGPIQISSSSHCAANNCLQIGGHVVAGASIARRVAIPEGSEATLTFSYVRRPEGTDGRVWVNVSEHLWSWHTLTTLRLDAKDDGQVAASFDLSEWAGETINIAFTPYGDFDGGYIYIDNVQVAMTSTNVDPTFTDNIPNQSNTEGDVVSVTTDAFDPDGHALTFSATGLPPGLSINASTGVIAGTVDYSASANSPYATTLTVGDGHGGSDQMSFSWAVADNNRPPTLATIADKNIGEGSELSVSVNADDPDLPYDTLTYSMPVAPSGATIDSNGKIRWTPNESAGPGTHEFTVKVVDSGDPVARATRSFTVAVSEVNATPKLSSIQDQANGVGDHVSLAVVATDADLPANTLTFSATGLPPGISINAGSGVMSGTIASSAPNATHEVTVKVKDNGSPALSTARTFAWRVTRDNHAPVLSAIPDQIAVPGRTLVFTASADDSDSGNHLEYWLAAATDPVPNGASINENTGRFTWKPANSQHDAIYRITVGVTDSGTPRLSDSQYVVISVPKINQAPTVADPTDQESAEGDTVTLEVKADDPDDSSGGLSFTAVGLPAGLAIDPATGVISGEVSYDAADQSPHDVSVTVADHGEPSKSATARFVWSVVNVNRAPTADPAAYIAVIDEPLSIVLDATDPDGDALAYAITVAPTAGTLTGEGASRVYNTPGGASTDEFSFSVSDGEFEVENVVTVEIRLTNNAPTAVQDAFDADFGETLQVAAPGLLANDSDLDGDALSVALISGPKHGQAVLDADGSFRYVPNDGFMGEDEFVYAATDTTGLAATARVVINVAALPLVAVDDAPRIDVLVSTTPLWIPVETGGESALTEISRAVVFALNSGTSAVPALSFPLLLLVIALVLGLTLGRISLLPVRAARMRETGWIESYDTTHGVGKLMGADDSGEVFVQARAVVTDEPLRSGQKVRFIASEMKGRRLAIKVWPAE